MDKLHTHYDNLKVTRNAPAEVIRAAYKTLSQKYHPDRHNGSAEATRVMAIVNGSYKILSDPVQRGEHDRWIEAEEAVRTAAQSAADRSPRPGPSVAAPPPITPQTTPPVQGGAEHKMVSILRHLLTYFVFYAVAAVAAWLYFDGKNSGGKSQPSGALGRYQAGLPSTQATDYVRPNAAPNGKVWPKNSGYISGYPQLNKTGLSTVKIDNGGNDADVYVKLVVDPDGDSIAVRHLFIPAGGTFTVRSVRAGAYDIRYRDLNSGRLSRSESFYLEQVAEPNGTRYSNLTMTLYKVRGGNMKTFGITESEF